MVLAIVPSGITLADPIPKASVEKGNERSQRAMQIPNEDLEEIKDYD